MPKLKEKRKQKIDVEPLPPLEPGEPVPPWEGAHPVDWAEYNDNLEAWKAKKDFEERERLEKEKKVIQNVMTLYGDHSKEGESFEVVGFNHDIGVMYTKPVEKPPEAVEETALSGCPNCVQHVEIPKPSQPKKYKKCYIAKDEKGQIVLAFVPDEMTTKQLGRIAQIVMEAGLDMERGTTLDASELFELQVIEDDPQKKLPFPEEK